MRIPARVSEIKAQRKRRSTVWPVINQADTEAGTVSREQLAKLRGRGLVAARSLPAGAGADLYRPIVPYVANNHFFEDYRAGPLTTS